MSKINVFIIIGPENTFTLYLQLITAPQEDDKYRSVH